MAPSTLSDAERPLNRQPHAPHVRRADAGWHPAAFAVIGVVLGLAAIICLYILWRGPNRKLFPWSKTDEEKAAARIAKESSNDTASDEQSPDPATWREGASAGADGVVLPMRKMEPTSTSATTHSRALSTMSVNTVYTTISSRASSLPPNPFPMRPTSAGSEEFVAPRPMLANLHAPHEGPGMSLGQLPGRTASLGYTAGSPPLRSPTSPSTSSYFQNADITQARSHQLSPPGSIYSMPPGSPIQAPGIVASPPPGSKRRSAARRSNGSIGAPPIPSPLGLGVNGHEVLDPLREEASQDGHGYFPQTSPTTSQGSSPTKSHRSVSFVKSSPPRPGQDGGLAPPRERPVMMPLDKRISGGGSIDRRQSRSTPPALPPGAGAPNSRTSWQTHHSSRSSTSTHHMSGPRRPVYPDGQHVPTLPNVYAPEAYGPEGFVPPRASSIAATATAPHAPRGLWGDSTMAAPR